jgi:hypothetical protein
MGEFADIEIDRIYDNMADDSWMDVDEDYYPDTYSTSFRHFKSRSFPTVTIYYALPYSEIKVTTEKAWLISSKFLERKEEWFPKSKCRLLDNNRISVPDWLALLKQVPIFELEII